MGQSDDRFDVSGLWDGAEIQQDPPNDPPGQWRYQAPQAIRVEKDGAGSLLHDQLLSCGRGELIEELGVLAKEGGRPHQRGPEIPPHGPLQLGDDPGPDPDPHERGIIVHRILPWPKAQRPAESLGLLPGRIQEWPHE